MKRLVKWLCLAAGLLFLIFSNGRYAVAFAPWAAYTLLLYFSRKMKPWTGFAALSLGVGVCTQLSFWAFSSRNPHTVLFYLPFFLGILLAVPFLADRLLRGYFNGVVKTLVFPAAYTAVEFLYVSLCPLGSTGTLAYSQTEFTTLIQIASVTGIYGITFLITWFASTAAETAENIRFGAVKTAGRQAAAFCAVFLVVLGFGGIRLLIPDSSETVQVSGIHLYDLRAKDVQSTWDAVQQKPGDFKAMSDKILSDLISSTEKEAQAGSKIVVWSEISPLLLYQDENLCINEIKDTARNNQVMIVACPYILSENLSGKDTNELLIVDSGGNIVMQHTKFGGAAFDNIVEGDQKLKAVKTDYGTLSGVICWDADFPPVMRQEGRLGTDILLTPAADWKEIDPIHSAPAYFRGIENGMAVLRETADGLSFASDAKGRYLAKTDHYAGGTWTTVAQIPIKGCFTLYPVIGDTFAVCDVILLLSFIVLGLLKKTKRIR